ncbi:MAG: hypothetical protein HUN04_15480 [Desulfobacter sp.]|nr:MAG: hypothetical protein HUN04_15480 [Desulfobacter sp.]
MKPTLIKQIILCTFLMLTAGTAAGKETPLKHAPYSEAVKCGAMSDSRIQEISGLCASRRKEKGLWMVNDSGNRPYLYLVSSDGQLLGEHSVQGVENTDWEDLSGFSHGDQNFLVIADVGDNRAQREVCTLFFVREPDPAQGEAQPLPLGWQMQFRYEDGPRDCEAVAVDSPNKRILLLSKREKYPTLYELPLVLPPRGIENKDRVYRAKPIARIETLPQPTPADLKEKYGKYRSWPTAMDISADGATLVILTYKHAYLFRRQPGRDWDQAVQSPPELIPLPLPETGELIQREALCIDHESGRIFVTTEQLPAPIYALDPVK